MCRNCHLASVVPLRRILQIVHYPSRQVSSFRKKGNLFTNAYPQSSTFLFSTCSISGMINVYFKSSQAQLRVAESLVVPLPLHLTANQFVTHSQWQWNHVLLLDGVSDSDFPPCLPPFLLTNCKGTSHFGFKTATTITASPPLKIRLQKCSTLCIHYSN